MSLLCHASFVHSGVTLHWHKLKTVGALNIYGLFEKRFQKILAHNPHER